MTVLPYVAMSLVGGLGALSRTEASRLGTRVGAVLLVLWAIALVAVFSFPVMFPHLQTASFFSTTLLEDSQPLDLVSLYIQANPFNSLANNVVPAVVLFSALLGIALIGIPGKQATLEALDVLNRAVSRVARFIVSLTPVRAVRDCGGHRRHDGPGGGGTTADIHHQLRGDVPAAHVLGAPRTDRGAHAGAPPRRTRAHPRLAADGVLDRQPVRRAAAPGGSTRQLLREHAQLAPSDERLPAT